MTGAAEACQQYSRGQPRVTRNPSDDTMPHEVDMQARGARSVFKNMAFVEEADVPNGGLAAATPAVKTRRNSQLQTAFAEPGPGTPSTARRSADCSSSDMRSMPSTWASSSTTSSTPPTRRAEHLQQQHQQPHTPKDPGFNFFGTRRPAPPNPNADEVMEIEAAEDEVQTAGHHNHHGHGQGQAHAQAHAGFDGQASIRSNTSWQPAQAAATRGQALHVWEAEAAAMVDSGSAEEAVSRPAPSTGLVQCTVKVERGLFGKPGKISLYLDNGGVFLMAARKRKKSKASNYVISLDEGDLSKDGPSCTAKLRANFMGTEYALCSRSRTNRAEHSREEVCVFFKQTMFTSAPGPRVMMVALPLPEVSWCPIEKDGSDTLPACLEKARLRELGPAQERKLCVLGNRPPEWDERVKAHTLDFHGRVKLSSVKNFQLVTWDHNSDVKGTDLILQFGKVDECTYSLDFSYPMSAKRAFAIALASMDTKLAYAI